MNWFFRRSVASIAVVSLLSDPSVAQALTIRAAHFGPQASVNSFFIPTTFHEQALIAGLANFISSFDIGVKVFTSSTAPLKRFKYRFIEAPRDEQRLIRNITPEDMADLHDNTRPFARGIRIWKTNMIQNAMRVVPRALWFASTVASVIFAGSVVPVMQVVWSALLEDRIGVAAHSLINVLPFPLARERDARRSAIYGPEGLYGYRTVEDERFEIEKEVFIPSSPNKLWILSDGRAISVTKDESAVVSRDDQTIRKRYQGLIDRSWSRKRIVDEIHALLSQGVELSTQAIMHSEHQALYESAKSYFGSWRAALKAAGIDPEAIRRPTATPQFTEEWVRDQILTIHAEKGYAGLTTTALKAAGKINVYDAARARFDDWPTAVRKSGLDPTEVEKAFKFDLKDVADRIAVKLIGALPRDVAIMRLRWRYIDRQVVTPGAVKTADRRLFLSLKKHFDSWLDALTAAGIPEERVMPPSRAVNEPAFSTDEVLDTIRSLANEKTDLGRRSAGKYFPNLKEAAEAHFGNWQQALVKSGVDYAAVVTEAAQTQHTRAWVLQAIKDRFETHGYAGLTRKSLEDAGLGHLYDAGRNRFGKWTRAVDAAGFDSGQIPRVTTGEKVWSRERVIAEIKRLHVEGVDLGSQAVRDAGYKSLWYAAVRYLGGWAEAVRAAGLDYDNEIRKTKRWSAEKVRSEIIERHKAKEDLSQTGVKQRGLGALFEAGERYFGSWGAAVESAGLRYGDVRRTEIRSREAALAAIRDRVAAGLDVTSTALLKSDPNLTQAIYKYFGLPNTAVAEAGFDPRTIRRALGTWRLSRLWPEEVAFGDQLAEALTKEGIPRSYSSYIATTLMRLKGRSFRLLVQEGFLTEAQYKALIDLDLEKLNVPALATSLRNLMEAYRQQGWSAERISRILNTSLIPWSYIEKLQRTYRLGRRTDLIEESLRHPDMEAWIRKSREAQEQRGTLDREKHLERYSRESRPLVFGNEKANIREELQSRLRTLIALLAASPEVERYAYTIEHRAHQAVVVRIANGKKLSLRVGQTVALPALGINLTIRGVAQQERTVTLQLPEGVKQIPDGVLLAAPSNRPLELQIEQLTQAIRSLERSQDRTTGLPILDRLLGLTSLRVGSAEPSSVKKFVNVRIPYQRTSEIETTGDQSQEIAVQLAMEPTEVEFIEGPPGTGKTTVIAEIIRQAVARGQRVLLVSQMHQAVDNALAEVMNDPAIPCLRVGNNPASFEYGTERVWAGDDKALRRFAQRRRTQGRGYVIAGTNMGIATERAIGLDQRDLQFDLMIMDEASRETLPGALIPSSYLKQSGKAIFVGDVRQLPPFGITAEQRAEAGLSEAQVAEYNVSALETLLGKGYGDRVMLSTNYRSHPLIAGLISKLFYEGDIHRRGWEDFDEETLSLRVVDVAAEPDVYHEERVGSSYRNRSSAREVLALVERYRARGIASQDITIVAPYMAQVEFLQGELRKALGNDLPLVTTIDAYQGGENQAIIFDFVRSNREGRIGFVKDLRRLNVALSRAKENLGIVWDSRTMTGQAPQYSPEDQAARQLFQAISSYYEAEVRSFYPASQSTDSEEDGGLSSGLLPWWKAVIPSLRERGWSDRRTAGALGAAEELLFSGAIVSVLTSVLGWLGIDPITALWTASLVRVIIFPLAHTRERFRLKGGQLTTVSPNDKAKDLATLSLVGAVLGLVFALPMVLLPFSIFNVAVALPLVSIVHGVYNAFIAPALNWTLGMASRSRNFALRDLAKSLLNVLQLEDIGRRLQEILHVGVVEDPNLPGALLPLWRAAKAGDLNSAIRYASVLAYKGYAVFPVKVPGWEKQFPITREENPEQGIRNFFPDQIRLEMIGKNVAAVAGSAKVEKPGYELAGNIYRYASYGYVIAWRANGVFHLAAIDSGPGNVSVPQGMSEKEIEEAFWYSITFNTGMGTGILWVKDAFENLIIVSPSGEGTFVYAEGLKRDGDSNLPMPDSGAPIPDNVPSEKEHAPLHSLLRAA